MLALVAVLLCAPPVGQLLELREGTLTYTVVHKLHEVRGTTRQVEGRALAQPDGTIRVQVRAKVSSFDSGNGNRDEHVREVTHEPAHPFVQVKGSAQNVTVSGPADVTLDSTVDLNGVQKQQQIPVHLEPGGTVSNLVFGVSC